MYARGSIAKGMCQRCGLQFLLPELRFDGYYPNLRVCDGCYDPPQPQEKLAIVSDPEGLWRPAPDDYLVTAPLLVITAGPSSAQPIGLEEGGGGIFEQEGGEGYIAAEGGSSGAYILNWSGFNVAGPEITAGYLVQRSVDKVNWTTLATLANTADEFGALTVETNTYIDTPGPGLFYYRIFGYDVLFNAQYGA